MTKKDAVIVYGAGISGRGAAQVLADKKQQVYLYNDMDCTLEPQLLQLLESVGGGLQARSSRWPMPFATVISCG